MENSYSLEGDTIIFRTGNNISKALLGIDPDINVISIEADETFSRDLKSMIKLLLQFRQRYYPDYKLRLNNINKTILFDYLKQTNSHPLLQAGFVPSVSSSLYEDIARMYLRLKEVGWKELNKQLYEDNRNKAILSYLATDSWIYIPTEYLLDTAQKNPGSALAILGGRQELTFGKSKRAYTDMSTLRPSNFATIQLSQEQMVILRNQRILVMGNNVYLPVTRYAEGMSRGAYYGETNSAQYCGTFYYLEEQSEVLLSVAQKRMLYFKNKVEAAKWIIDRNITDNITRLTNLYKGVLEEYYEKLWKAKLIDVYLAGNLALQEIELLLTSDGYQSKYLGIDEYYQDLSTGEYKTIFYALEDSLDQAICEGLRQLNCDVAILGMMAGKTRMVAEVLDTRTREKSLASLVYIVK